MNLGKFKKAERYYKEALRMQPEYVQAYLGYAYLLGKMVSR